MTIDELITRLEVYRDELGGDCEVRLMTQQQTGRMFENAIEGLASSIDMADSFDSDITSDDALIDAYENGAELYIVQGNQLGYGTAAAWQVAQ